MANRDLKRITGLFAFEWYDDGVLKLIKISCTNKSIHRASSTSCAAARPSRRDRRLCVMPLTFWLHFKTKAPTIRIFIAPFPGDLLWPFSLPPPLSFCSSPGRPDSPNSQTARPPSLLLLKLNETYVLYTMYTTYYSSQYLLLLIFIYRHI